MRAEGSSVFAHEMCAAKRARKTRSEGVSPLDDWDLSMAKA